ncbi:MAG: type II toxin-antitoxin system VapC family toxin [Methanophagales archaeon]|nr:type II toxin-antitoxin system VapC family toxin [Methanophagales archaeon]
MKLLDTSVLIDIDIGGNEVLEKAKALDREGRHAISTVSLYEFYWGIYRKYEFGSRKYNEAMKKAEKLFLRFFSLTITPEVAIRAAEIGTALISKGEEIGVNDTYIAATALVRGLTLVTTDVAHFKRIEGLTMEEW